MHSGPGGAVVATWSFAQGGVLTGASFRMLLLFTPDP